jgi:hypothetical protein
MNYNIADSKLQGRNKLSRKVANNTYLVRNSDVPGDSIHLKLHDTYVVTWYADGRVELNSGGWQTPTTKERIKGVLEGYTIRQERGVWYLSQHTNGPEYWKDLGVFADGLTIHADGTITGMLPLDEAKTKNKLRRRVAMFASNYMRAFKAGEIPAPGNGDCLYCNVNFQTDKKQTLGEAVRDDSHIQSHLDENYFVPSLLSRAYEAMPHSPAMGWALAKAWSKDPQWKDSLVPEFVYGQLQKSLSRYMLRQLGQAA